MSKHRDPNVVTPKPTVADVIRIGFENAFWKVGHPALWLGVVWAVMGVLVPGTPIWLTAAIAYCFMKAADNAMQGYCEHRGLL